MSTPPAYPPVCSDEELLIRFVIWRLRYGELPPDVQAAALRLSDRYPRDGEDLYLARNRHHHSQLIA